MSVLQNIQELLKLNNKTNNLIFKKWVKDLNRHLAKDTQMQITMLKQPEERSGCFCGKRGLRHFKFPAHHLSFAKSLAAIHLVARTPCAACYCQREHHESSNLSDDSPQEPAQDLPFVSPDSKHSQG